MQQLISFLNQNVFLQTTYGELMLSVAIVLFAVLVNAFMHRILLSVVKRMAGVDAADDKTVPIVDALEKPLKIVPMAVGGFLVLYILNLHGAPLIFASDLLKTILVGVFFWSGVRYLLAADSVVARMGIDVEASVQSWLDMVIVLLLCVFGVAVLLDIWGVSIAPLIGSLGVLGIGVGMAARDLFTNLISGILIMTEKRFVPGEWISVDGVVDGTVEKINFRSTLVRLFDSSPAYVPNGLLADQSLVNYSRMINRRIYWQVGLEYSTAPATLRKIRDATEQWILQNPKFCSPHERTLFVRIDSFGSSEINMMVYCFTKTTVWGEWLAAKEELALALIDIVVGAGSGFAFPSRTLFFGDNLPPTEAPEAVDPRSVLNNLT